MQSDKSKKNIQIYLNPNKYYQLISGCSYYRCIKIYILSANHQCSNSQRKKYHSICKTEFICSQFGSLWYQVLPYLIIYLFILKPTMFSDLDNPVQITGGSRTALFYKTLQTTLKLPGLQLSFLTKVTNEVELPTQEKTRQASIEPIKIPAKCFFFI